MRIRRVREQINKLTDGKTAGQLTFYYSRVRIISYGFTILVKYYMNIIYITYSLLLELNFSVMFLVFTTSLNSFSPSLFNLFLASNMLENLSPVYYQKEGTIIQKSGMRHITSFSEQKSSVE